MALYIYQFTCVVQHIHIRIIFYKINQTVVFVPVYTRNVYQFVVQSYIKLYIISTKSASESEAIAATTTTTNL